MQRAATRRAAQYVRMSTEHQRYSITFQQAANAAYALEHGYELVRAYVDGGVSGLSIKGRNGLRDLLADTVSGCADFDLLLVYDVSRWGRFQDPDEAAHYEFVCREAGVRVEYTAEPFANDGSLTSTIVKHLKRAMAAEYSRELSVKVATAQRGLSREGYWRGSPSSYGFRRCEVRDDGTLGAPMERGERKALQGHRVVLVLGPDAEVAVVRRIFSEFVVHGLSTVEIARGLNADGVRNARGTAWTPGGIRRALDDEKYAGVLVAGRVRSRLRKFERAPREDWIRVPGACPAIVSPEMFRAAQSNLHRYHYGVTDEELLEGLRRLLAREGRLSTRVITNDRSIPSPAIYLYRFGGLLNAYRRIGYEPNRQQRAVSAALNRRSERSPVEPAPHEVSDEALTAALRALYVREGTISCALIDVAPDLPSSSACRLRLGGMRAIYDLVGHPASARQRRACGPEGDGSERNRLRPEAR